MFKTIVKESIKGFRQTTLTEVICRNPLISSLFLYFYFCSRDSSTTVSTWLDCSRLMSDFRGRSREFIKAYFCLKTHRFLPLYVLGNRSIWLSLLIIWNRQILQSPQSYALREQVRNPIVSTLILPVTEFVLFSASAWTWIITSYLLWPVCSFLNHKWYFAIIHKRKFS